MKIYNLVKTSEINENEVDYLTERLVQDKIFVKHHDAILEIPKKSHYETIKEYSNGGKDVVEVVDIEYVAPKDAYDEYEDILRVEKLSREEILNNLRQMREEECFSIINRGLAWYSKISVDQNLELNRWYNQWLDITNSYFDDVDVASIIPIKPSWLK